MADELIFITADNSTSLALPFADNGIRAGFPSPAQDYMDKSLDLNRDLIKHPEATFYARVVGDSMIPEMYPDDILVIDKSVSPYDGCLAVCFLNGEFTIKRLEIDKANPEVIRLIPSNKEYAPIIVCENDQFETWGVVRYIIHTAT